MSEQDPEIGIGDPRGRPLLSTPETARKMSDHFGEEIVLGPNIVVHGGPTTCPACGSKEITWACDLTLDLTRENVHPVMWHETEWLADSYVCRDCRAGWIEPDEPEPITWVRPYDVR